MKFAYGMIRFAGLIDSFLPEWVYAGRKALVYIALAYLIINSMANRNRIGE